MSVFAKLRLAAGACLLTVAATGGSAAAAAEYDVVVRGGTIYDGSGGAPYAGDVAIKGDRIAYVGPKAPGAAAKYVDASGLAVAPGFINMLSWATESLIVDPRGQSDLRQGVTLEVMGEGWSMGPLNDEMKKLSVQRQGDIKYPIEWTTLGEYLGYLEKKGIALNVASFVGATTVRQHELGERDVDPNAEQLQRMRALVHKAMEEGALGVGTSLIYPPASFAETDELVALTSEAAACGGMYISHMRSEGDRLLESIDELIEISRRSGAPAEIYHLKQAGRANWDKLDQAIAKVEAARASGLRITADMYTYTAGGTGLAASMPPWVQDGGNEAMLARLRDPEIVARVKREMLQPGKDWENLYLHAGPEGVLLANITEPSLKPLIGKTVAEAAKIRGVSPEQAVIDIVMADEGRTGALYFLMKEDNVRRQTALPWMSFGSDAEAAAPEGVFLKSSTHPRAYGNFARLLGKYVRDEKTTSLADAVRRLSSLPAGNLGLRDRGHLQAGMAADVVLFDPGKIADHATFEKPMQYATGVKDVFVNGTQVLKDGEPTGATPGRFVKGPGWTGWPGGGACRKGERG
ncbi:N-acyl-D-amino-acid deacylase family protein [Sphingomonas hankyongi]|uniref:D-aminoacylase n=1 Tax=Sphingomonas hankyongi TaxID=2908209 RepID=A0ABT0S3J8_9SPHN|nr:D-aminoacylase [Sphingomonas hankyongi]MCL6730204.1 D-aminoacylase [Sphingomonas hankyongi]